MICAPAAGRPAFRVGVRDRNGRKHSEDGADDHIPKNNLGVCAGGEGRHSLRGGEAASRMDSGEIFSAEVKDARENVLSARQ